MHVEVDHLDAFVILSSRNFKLPSDFESGYDDYNCGDVMMNSMHGRVKGRTSYEWVELRELIQGSHEGLARRS